MDSIRFNATVHKMTVDKEGEARLTLTVPLLDAQKALPLAGLQSNLIVEVSVDPSERAGIFPAEA